MNKIAGFTFFRSYYESLKELEPDNRREIIDAILNYVFEDIEPEFSGLKLTIWALIVPNLNTSKNRAKNPTNRNKTKQTKTKRNKTKQTKTKQNNDLLKDKEKDKKKEQDMDMEMEEKENKENGNGVFSSLFNSPEIEERATLGNSRLFDFNWIDDD